MARESRFLRSVVGDRDFVVTVLLAAMVLVFLLATGCAGSPDRQSTGEYIDDAAIAAKVKTQLFRDPAVSGFQVNVETYKGQVQLSGFVETPEQRAKAAEIARGVAGVKAVTNDIIVKSK